MRRPERRRIGRDPVHAQRPSRPGLHGHDLVPDLDGPDVRGRSGRRRTGAEVRGADAAVRRGGGRLVHVPGGGPGRPAAAGGLVEGEGGTADDRSSQRGVRRSQRSLFSGDEKLPTVGHRRLLVSRGEHLWTSHVHCQRRRCPYVSLCGVTSS